MSDEHRLPPEILAKASRLGSEYAWPVEDIPTVIEAGRKAGLINVGGQLQFRIPDGGTCECYWVQVDTSTSVPDALPLDERVEQTAAIARRDFARLKNKVDFLAEGRANFQAQLDEYERRGGDPSDAMCFVWYVESGQ